jgi:hypothetical protein
MGLVLDAVQVLLIAESALIVHGVVTATVAVPVAFVGEEAVLMLRHPDITRGTHHLAAGVLREAVTVDIAVL